MCDTASTRSEEQRGLHQGRAYTEVTERRKRPSPLHIQLTVKRYMRGGAKGGKGYMRPQTPYPDCFDDFSDKVMKLDQPSFEASVRKMHSLISDLHNKMDIGFPERQIIEPQQPPTVDDVLDPAVMEEKYGPVPEGRDEYIRFCSDMRTKDCLRNAELEKRRKNYHRHYKANASESREEVMEKLRDRFLSVKSECVQRDLGILVTIIE